MPIEPDDVMLNKAGIMERSLRRALEEYHRDPTMRSYTHIDAMTLNLERACQAAIDMAIHVCACQRLGIPQNSAEAFLLLQKAGLIERDTAKKMVSMVGFRNIAVHEYQELELEVLKAIAEREWKSLVGFCEELGLQIHP